MREPSRARPAPAANQLTPAADEYQVVKEQSHEPVAPPGSALPVTDPVTYRYLAREPILDKHGCVSAYELLFRNRFDEHAFSADGNLATKTMIDNSILFGLHNLTNGASAFVNCTAEVLTGDHVRILPPALTVLEVLETVPPCPALVAACRKLRAEGYRLSLDDFVYRAELEPLVEIADFIKIDFVNTSADERRNTLARLDGFKGSLIAEKVENHAHYAEACSEGFTLFQGFYFCRPLLLKKGKVPANRVVHLRLLELLHDDPLNLVEIDEIVKLEPALTYRLLRYVNSPIYGLCERITSIRAALFAVGDDFFRRMATLAVMSELNCGRCDEILRLALVRARFCESMAILYDVHPAEQYLLGLFSLLPAMLQLPMEEAISGLPLRDPLRDALLGEPNHRRRQLEWLDAHEHGDFERADDIARRDGLEGCLMSERFTEATLWADQMLTA